VLVGYLKNYETLKNIIFPLSTGNQTKWQLKEITTWWPKETFG
jgi:hypothetical protein